jgi:hypothetical protein
MLLATVTVRGPVIEIILLLECVAAGSTPDLS